MTTMIVSNPTPVTTKSARFHNTVFIKEIPSARTYSMLEKRLCWYTNDDYRSFKLNMFLERSTLTFPHPVDDNDDDKKIQVHRTTAGIDQSPDIPRRSVSPNRERISSELPSPPLYTNQSFDDDSSLEEAPTEQQVLKAKSMRERLRQLRDERQQQREVQSASRSPPSFRNNYGERQIISESDPLDMSVRQYVPFPDDDDDDESSKPVRTVIKNILPKQYAFQHPQCSRSSPYYPTKSLSQAVQVVAGGNRGNIESILDSVLSTVAS